MRFRKICGKHWTRLWLCDLHTLLNPRVMEKASARLIEASSNSSVTATVAGCGGEARASFADKALLYWSIHISILTYGPEL